LLPGDLGALPVPRRDHEGIEVGPALIDDQTDVTRVPRPAPPAHPAHAQHVARALVEEDASLPVRRSQRQHTAARERRDPQPRRDPLAAAKLGPRRVPRERRATWPGAIRLRVVTSTRLCVCRRHRTKPDGEHDADDPENLPYENVAANRAARHR
jgi:hypothetical protein